MAELHTRRSFLGLAARTGAVASVAAAAGGAVGCAPTWQSENPHDVRLRPVTHPGTRKLPPLFEAYPKLDAHVPWLSLGTLPTPVQRLVSIDDAFPGRQLWIKRDDMSSDIYGGNKVRKLEFLIGDAFDHGRETLITVGGIGSHQCCAVGHYARMLGVRGSVVLFPQPVTKHTRTNLLINHRNGAEMVAAANYADTVLKVWQTYRRHEQAGHKPYFIYSGGSTPLGVLGYLDAMFELKTQIEAGLMPMPDVLFVPAGSCGTIAGIVWGARLLGMKFRIVGVRVVDRIATNGVVIDWLIQSARKNVLRFDPAFPAVAVGDFEMEHDYFGGTYGLPTDAGMRAQKLMDDEAGIPLELTYSAKTFAAVIDYLGKDASKGQTILYWDTYNSVPNPHPLPDPAALPSDFQWVWKESPVA